MPKFEKKPQGEGREEWSKDAMKLALAAILENEMSEKKGWQAERRRLEKVKF